MTQNASSPPTPAQAPSAPASADAPPPTLGPAQMEAALRTAGASDPTAVLRGFRAQREELGEQLETLEEQRQEISQEMLQARNQGMDATGLQNRLVEIDKRIVSVDQQIAAADLEVARATAVPGAVAPEPREAPVNRGGDDDAENLVGGFVLAWAIVLPIWAYRRWRRRRLVHATPAVAAESGDRLRSIEQSVEAIAMEMERIGEGQRFMSRLFTERGGISALGEGAAQPVAAPARDRASQTPSR